MPNKNEYTPAQQAFYDAQSKSLVGFSPEKYLHVDSVTMTFKTVRNGITGSTDVTDKDIDKLLNSVTPAQFLVLDQYVDILIGQAIGETIGNVLANIAHIRTPNDVRDQGATLAKHFEDLMTISSGTAVLFFIASARKKLFDTLTTDEEEIVLKAVAEHLSSIKAPFESFYITILEAKTQNPDYASVLAMKIMNDVGSLPDEMKGIYEEAISKMGLAKSSPAAKSGPVDEDTINEMIRKASGSNPDSPWAGSKPSKN